MSEPHVHTAACYDREDGRATLACGLEVECDHEWSMGACKLCKADCPDHCDYGSHSADQFSHRGGHYTTETPCETCNPAAHYDPEEARADYEMDARKDRDW